jgi:hypothetical protein
MRWRPVLTCRYCHQPVGEAHWQLFQHATCHAPAPAAQPLPDGNVSTAQAMAPEAKGPIPWAVQKLLNRTDKYLTNSEQVGGDQRAVAQAKKYLGLAKAECRRQPWSRQRAEDPLMLAGVSGAGHR